MVQTKNLNVVFLHRGEAWVIVISVASVFLYTNPPNRINNWQNARKHPKFSNVCFKLKINLIKTCGGTQQPGIELAWKTSNRSTIQSVEKNREVKKKIWKIKLKKLLEKITWKNCTSKTSWWYRMTFINNLKNNKISFTEQQQILDCHKKLHNVLKKFLTYPYWST